MNNLVKVGVIGASGYAGAELVRLLLNHKNVLLYKISSTSFEKQPITDLYPSFTDILEDKFCSCDEVINSCNVVFAGLPHGLSEKIAKQVCEKNGLFIDLGPDFRLWNEDKYKQYYGLEFKEKELHNKAIYGLSEIYKDKIQGAKIIANPGCYPTSIQLGLYPVLKEKIVSTKGIVIDSKSGTTGAGRGLAQKTHFPECNESFAPYAIGGHRHIPEIEQMLSDFAKEDITVTFTPHLLPVNRGIVSTMYCDITKNIKLEDLYYIYKETYKNNKFIRICPLGTVANLKNVRYSNYCDISLHIDIHSQKLIVVSTIDNMIKGAAGQAIHNMNIALGYLEEEGLMLIPPAF